MNDTGSKMKYKTVFRLKDLLSSIIFAHDSATKNMIQRSLILIT